MEMPYFFFLSYSTLIITPLWGPYPIRFIILYLGQVQFNRATFFPFAQRLRDRRQSFWIAMTRLRFPKVSKFCQTYLRINFIALGRKLSVYSVFPNPRSKTKLLRSERSYSTKITFTITLNVNNTNDLLDMLVVRKELASYQLIFILLC